MKHYLLLPVAAAFLASPALAQTTETNSSNLKENVIEGAKESAEPGVVMPNADKSKSIEQSAEGTSTNSSNRKEDVLEGAKESAEPGLMQGRAATDSKPSQGDSSLSDEKKPLTQQ